MVRPDGSVSNGSSSTQLGSALLSAPILTLRWYRLPITLSVKKSHEYLYYKKHAHKYLLDMYADNYSFLTKTRFWLHKLLIDGLEQFDDRLSKSRQYNNLLLMGN